MERSAEEKSKVHEIGVDGVMRHELRNNRVELLLSTLIHRVADGRRRLRSQIRREVEAHAGEGIELSDGTARVVEALKDLRLIQGALDQLRLDHSAGASEIAHTVQSLYRKFLETIVASSAADRAIEVTLSGLAGNGPVWLRIASSGGRVEPHTGVETAEEG